MTIVNIVCFCVFEIGVVHKCQVAYWDDCVKDKLDCPQTNLKRRIVSVLPAIVELWPDAT